MGKLILAALCLFALVAGNLAIALVAPAARLVLAAPDCQATPKASDTYTVECAFSNQAYSGFCRVSEKVSRTVPPAAACKNVLSCLNNSQCTKTYCNATTIRGGWKLESSRRQPAK
jgi:hypothetical protein